MKGIFFDPPDLTAVRRDEDSREKQRHKAGSGGISDKVRPKGGQGKTRWLQPAVFRAA
jgi:hypothetical protein